MNQLQQDLILLMLLKHISQIKGLRYIENCITPQQKEQVLAIINSHQWCRHLRRPQQYYGIKYFQTKIEDSVLQPTISDNHHSLELFNFLIKKAIKLNIFQQSNPPNQILINKYIKGDKLGLHVEDIEAFGPIIAGLSIGTTEYLRLVDASNRQNSYLLEIKDCSCYVLEGEARYNYRHGIGRVMNNEKYKDDDFLRISVTLRHVIQSRRKVDEGQAKKILQQK